jgi:hypothetical protein
VANTAAATKPAKQKTKDPNDKHSPVKKRKIEREGTPTMESDDKRPLPTTHVPPEVVGQMPMHSETVDGVHQQAIAGGMPHGPNAPPIFMSRQPQMFHGLPAYPMQQRSGIAGFPPYGHHPDLAMYPPFATANFREPWNLPLGAAPDNGFEEYVNQDYAHQQHQFGQPTLALSSLPMRIPPPPQETMPTGKPEQGVSEDEEGVLRSGEDVVVVE